MEDQSSPTPLLSDYEQPGTQPTDNNRHSIDIVEEQPTESNQETNRFPAWSTSTATPSNNTTNNIPVATAQPYPQQQQTSYQEPSSSDGFPVVEVVAPATLQVGYTFDVMVQGRVLSVTVPPGGVREGQAFEAKTKPPAEDSQTLLQVPTGFWKDDFFDVCRFGPLHPSIFLAVFCPLISLGQIISRLGLTWNGQPAQVPNQTKYAFIAFVTLTFIHFFPFWVNMIFITYVAGKIRFHIRERYSIPPTMAKIIPNDGPRCRFSEVYYHTEDFFLSCCCMPCTVSQMNRHTAVYETYAGTYCTDTGLPKHVPLIV